MRQGDKPHKKTDKVLWELLTHKISIGSYIFLKHAKERLRERCINDIDVIDILEDRINRKRRRNKSKDTYETGHHDWNYCIEGRDLEGHKIRIIISFDSNLMLVITVMRLDD